jgi:HSP20 family protein
MDLIRWGSDLADPVRGLDRLQREINQLFDLPRFDESRGLFDRMVSPAIDLIETADGFRVHADLPGIKLEDIDISIASNVLTLKGEKKKSAQESGTVYRKETWEGSFQRTISLPTTVDPDQIKATFRDGVLEVHIPKKEEARPKRITVKTS